LNEPQPGFLAAAFSCSGFGRMTIMTDDALIAHLNQCDLDGFVARLGTLYEHSPWVAAGAWRERPFPTRMALHAAMEAVVRGAAEPVRLALIRAHPDLAGKLARAGELAPHSSGEQKGLGLDQLPDEEYERFDRLNTAYRARFGFPFIIAVRAHTRTSVLDAFTRRLQNSADQEHDAALTEIGKIAWLRLQDLT
jgi:2-oxo-4-hydroxy-4-carboxy-5-ureidoimidazoline decarboxylase